MSYERNILEGSVSRQDVRKELFVVYDINHVRNIVFCARQVRHDIYTAFDVRDLPEAQTCHKRSGLYMEIMHGPDGRSFRCARMCDPYSFRTLESMFRFENVSIRDIREIPNTRQDKRRFFAFCNSMDSDKAVVVQETFFEYAAGLDSLAQGAVIRCLPLKPRHIDVIRGHREYRGAFPVILDP